jgi:glycosyltransferase involved in cell wall biosynthesis
MKIAYITINVAAKIMTGGVGAKIKRQISLWKEMGHSVKLFILAPEPIPFRDSEQFIFKSLFNLFLLKFFTKEISRSRTLALMIAAVKKYQPDIIYLRFGLYTYPLHNLFKIAPVFLEVNSNDLDEYRTRGPFFYWLNRLTRGIVFSLCSALIPVSQTLADSNLKYGKPVCVVSNGIDLESFTPLPAPKNQSPVLTAIGSPGMRWHGMDKLFVLARKFPDLTINIIGYSHDDFLESFPTNLKIHGYLNSNQIRNIFVNTDVVFGSLALHRINIEEVPPLKIREALAFGIPIIIAHKDTDLQYLNLPTILKIPNTEDNVQKNTDKIRQFAYDMRGKRVDANIIRPYIDHRMKERKRLDFFAEVLAGSWR